MASFTTGVERLRVSTDTYPELATITSNRDDIRLVTNSWEVYMYIDEVQTDTSVKRLKITGVLDAVNEGQVTFYPRSKYCVNTSSSDVAYTGLTIAGTHTYSIAREKDFYYSSDTGTFVTLDKGATYIAYSSSTHTGLTRFDLFRESVTHELGSIIVTAAV